MKFFEKVSLNCLLLAWYSIAPSSGYGEGAPSVTCDNLLPRHGVSPQSSPSPYKVVPEIPHLKVGFPLRINLTSKTGDVPFKGFLVQVRKVGEESSDKAYFGGAFLEESSNKDARMLACSGKPNVAMTQTSAKAKGAVGVTWIPNSPGQYRIFTTFVKDKETFWANQMDDQIIEVHSAQELKPDKNGPSQNQNYDQLFGLCSTMKLNASLDPVTETTSPYTLMVGPASKFSSGKDLGDSHKVYQNNTLWINVTSDIGTPIQKMFLQVRPQRKASVRNPVAIGRFLGVQNPTGGKVQVVDCFGGKANAVLFVNEMHRKKTISDVSVLWQAPGDQVGDFVVVGTALSEEDVFWGKISDDPEAGKIKVIRNPALNKDNNMEHGNAEAAPSFTSSAVTLVVPLNVVKSCLLVFLINLIIYLK